MAFVFSPWYFVMIVLVIGIVACLFVFFKMDKQDKVLIKNFLAENQKQEVEVPSNETTSNQTTSNESTTNEEESKIKKCKYCGATNDIDAKKCSSCSADLYVE